MGSATVLYVGTNEGVVSLKSEDGRQWDVQSQGLKSWAVPQLEVQTSQPNRVFAGTRGDGVWVSEDFGQTWDKPCYGKPGPGKVRSVAISPRDPDTIYAGTEPIDIFVSHDAARSWERLDSVWDVPTVASVMYPVAVVEPHVRYIAFDPKEPDTMYAALQVGYMLKSTDSGRTWKLLDKGLDADVHTIVVDPVNPDRMYIATGGHDARGGRVQGRALYMSHDGGESWNPTAMEFQQEYSVPLAIHPENPAIVFAGVANGNPGLWSRPTGAESAIIRTRDGGEHWESVNEGLSTKGFADSIVFDEADPDRLYMGLRSGELYASQDGGDSWSMLDVKLSSVSDLHCVRA